MKQNATSKNLFDPAQVAAAIAAAPADPVKDTDNPGTKPGAWDNAVVSHSLPELRGKLAARRRGPQKAPLKVPTTLRLDADVLDALKASGKGWQTRVNDALRDLVKKVA
jgi:uncharacterized protein (DUF4415 family)